MTVPQEDPEFYLKKMISVLGKYELIHNTNYATSLSDWKRIQSQTKRILQENMKDNQSLLDVGCGCGAVCKILPYSSMCYLGIDTCRYVLSLAKEVNPNFEFIMGDIITGLKSYPDKCFNVALLRGAIEALKWRGKRIWEETLQELLRLSDSVIIQHYTKRYYTVITSDGTQEISL